MQEILHWESRIAEKGKELAELTQRIQDIRNVLNVFSGAYNSRVGVHYAKLDRIRLQIREYRHRLKKLKEGITELHELKDLEDEINDLFKEEREKVEKKEKAANQSSEKYRQHLRDRERAEMFSPEMEKKIKVMFRKLALRFHPDKAESPEEAAEFQSIMAAINEAYKKGDFNVLVLYMEQAERDEKIKTETPKEKLARLKQDYEKICQAVKKAQRALQGIIASDIFKLKQTVIEAEAEGRDLLSEMTRSASDKVRETKQELDELITQYQMAVDDLENPERKEAA